MRRICYTLFRELSFQHWRLLGQLKAIGKLRATLTELPSVASNSPSHAELPKHASGFHVITLTPSHLCSEHYACWNMLFYSLCPEDGSNNSSETLVPFYKTTRHHSSEASNISHCSSKSVVRSIIELKEYRQFLVRGVRLQQWHLLLVLLVYVRVSGYHSNNLSRVELRVLAQNLNALRPLLRERDREWKNESEVSEPAHSVKICAITHENSMKAMVHMTLVWRSDFVRRL